jgi:hypothetical protein
MNNYKVSIKTIHQDGGSQTTLLPNTGVPQAGLLYSAIQIKQWWSSPVCRKVTLLDNKFLILHLPQSSILQCFILPSPNII